jgi:hypothetical protein
MLQIKMLEDPVLGYLLRIFYGNETLDVSILSLVPKKISNDPYEPIVNNYLSTLLLTDQKRIFEIYKEVAQVSESNYSAMSRDYYTLLEDRLDELVNILNLDRINAYLERYPNLIAYPDDISETFIPDPDLTITEDKTYLKKDYRDLVGLLVLLRCCVPVFVYYYTNLKPTTKQSPSTKQFMFATLLLFTKSSLFESNVYLKLLAYVKAIQETFNTGSDSKFDQYVINEGLSKDDIITSIIAEILLNKLLFLDVSDPKNKIISFIYQTINVKSKSMASKGSMIKNKKETSNKNIEDKSYFEDYRKSSDIAIGTVAEIQYACGQLDKIILTLNAGNYFNLKEYEEQLVYSRDLIHAPIFNVQIHLLGWFLNRYIDPRALFYVDKTRLVELLSLAHVITWNMGHKFVSLLLVSSISEEDNNLFMSIRKTINKAIRDKLSTKYRFIMDEEGNIDPIEKTIETVCNDIISHQWVPYTNIEKLCEYNKTRRLSVINIPTHLADEIAKYSLDC